MSEFENKALDRASSEQQQMPTQSPHLTGSYIEGTVS
jgi:hypothetical protein